MLKLAFAIVLIGLPGCKSDGKLEPKVDNLGRATGPVDTKQPMGMDMKRPAAGEEPRDAEEVVITGTILETIDASRYTYVRLQVEGGEEIWTALPQIKLTVGQSIEVIQSLVMKDFESKTLGRVFPSVVFGVMKGQSPGPTMGDMGGGMGGMGGGM